MWAWHSSRCGDNPAWNMHKKFILVNCEQATSASTGDLKNMGHRRDATHKVLLVKCEEVLGDLKNNWAMFTSGLQNLLGCENISPIF